MMFEHLKKFKHVLVTGPQRSGTTICAKMIAHDTGLDFIPEENIGNDDGGKLAALMASSIRFVLQCPAICYRVHELGGRDDTAVVFVRRRMDDIIASQRRIGWGWEDYELQKYGMARGPIAKVKTVFWEKYQMGRIRHAFDVKFDGLKGHPLFVPRAARAGFGPRQTEVEW